jgi:lipid II:glycine glycyltransferase (peptidoglycan interpeptide bridge formation enzyme)
LLAAIRWAREEGCHTFDLGGIPGKGDTDPKRHRVAHLKADFAREPVELVRRHERIL